MYPTGRIGVNCLRLPIPSCHILDTYYVFKHQYTSQYCSKVYISNTGKLCTRRTNKYDVIP